MMNNINVRSIHNTQYLFVLPLVSNIYVTYPRSTISSLRFMIKNIHIPGNQVTKYLCPVSMICNSHVWYRWYTYLFLIYFSDFTYWGSNHMYLQSNLIPNLIFVWEEWIYLWTPMPKTLISIPWCPAIWPDSIGSITNFIEISQKC